MQDRMRGYGIVSCRDLHNHGLFPAGIDGDVPYIAGFLDISGKDEAVSATWDRCYLGRIGQGNYGFAGEEGNPSTVAS